MTSRHYSSDAKEVNNLIVVDCFKIGNKLGVVNIAIYGKAIRCSFNSFEQCSKVVVLFDSMVSTNCGVMMPCYDLFKWPSFLLRIRMT